jgi:hypothetical protein
LSLPSRLHQLLARVEGRAVEHAFESGPILERKYCDASTAAAALPSLASGRHGRWLPRGRLRAGGRWLRLRCDRAHARHEQVGGHDDARYDCDGGSHHLNAPFYV